MQTLAEQTDLLYWLHQEGFYRRTSCRRVARLMGNYQSQTVSVNAGCSLYRYEPSPWNPQGLTKVPKFSPARPTACAVRAVFLHHAVSDAQTILPELLDFLQNDTSDGVKSYLQMESAYREFVYSYALTVPAEFRAQLGAVLDEFCREYGSADSLTPEQAQLCTARFLEQLDALRAGTPLPLDRSG